MTRFILTVLVLLLSCLTPLRDANSRAPKSQQAYNPVPTKFQEVFAYVSQHGCQGDPNLEDCAEQVLNSCNTLQRELEGTSSGSLSHKINGMTNLSAELIGWWCLAEQALLKYLNYQNDPAFSSMQKQALALSKGGAGMKALNIASPGACTANGTANPFCGFPSTGPSEEYLSRDEGGSTPKNGIGQEMQQNAMKAFAEKCLKIDPIKLYGGASDEAPAPKEPKKEAKEANESSPPEPGNKEKESTKDKDKNSQGGHSDNNQGATDPGGQGNNIPAGPPAVSSSDNPNGLSAGSNGKGGGYVLYDTGEWQFHGFGGKDPNDPNKYGGGGGVYHKIDGNFSIGGVHWGSVSKNGAIEASIGVGGSFTPSPDANDAAWCEEQVAAYVRGCWQQSNQTILPQAECSLGANKKIAQNSDSDINPDGPFVMSCPCLKKGKAGEVFSGSGSNKLDASNKSNCPTCCSGGTLKPVDLPPSGGGQAKCDCSQCKPSAPNKNEICAAGKVGEPIYSKLCGNIDPTPMQTPQKNTIPFQPMPDRAP